MSKYLRKRKGGALALVLIVMMVLTILGGTVLRMAVAETNFSVRQENMNKAYYIARSGAQSIAEYMIRDPEGKAGEFLGKTSASNSQIGGGDFYVSVEEIPSSKDILVTSIGEYNGVKQTAKIRLKGTPETGIGGIFEHAIAAVDKLFAGNENANGTIITGSVVVKNGPVPDYIANKTTEGGGQDPTLIFPPIVLPPDKTPAIAYDEDFKHLNLQKKEDVKEIVSAKGTPKYIKADSISIKQGKLSIVGDGIVHLYVVKGNIDIETQAQIYVDVASKLYIYVIPPLTEPKTVKFSGSGSLNSLFLYAPESNVEWNNAQAGDIFGAIIAKTVEIHNFTKIKYNGDLITDVDLDTSGVGVNYEGYIWVD